MRKTRNQLIAGLRYGAILAVLLLGLVSIIGTGSSSSGGGAGASSGVFVNSPVDGLYYESTPSGYTGHTASGGVYQYIPGDTVGFFLGGPDGLFLGSADAQGIVRPDDIAGGDTARATRIGQLLQTLDQDGVSNNGITIPAAVTEVLAAGIDLDSNAAFETSMTTLLTSLNAEEVFPEPRILVSAEAARDQLDNAKKDPVVVTTNYGDLRGYVDSGIQAWRGIPYAAPPVGDLRWKAPQEPEAWNGERFATTSGPPSLQFEMKRTWQQTGRIIGSEDCLYLDIYRPDTDDVLPVYFWIHGGSNKFGGAAEYQANAKAMAEKRDVVVVLVQYRLGPFGWFRHDELRNDDIIDPSNSGNFGTLDQIKALEWVSENIAVFGGDADNVTIAGQSAGGHNVMNLFISPLAEGLFHKAVSQSGIMPVIAASDRIAVDAEYAELTAEELRALSATDVLLDTAAVGTFNAFADGYVVPDTVINALHQGNYNDVPIIIGHNQDEWFNFVPLYGPILGGFVGQDFSAWAKVYDLFDPGFDPAYEWTYEEIFPSAFTETVYEGIGSFASLRSRAKYLDELGRELQESGAEVYAYYFQWAGGGIPEMNDFETIFGAAHSMEISFFFGGPESLFGYSFVPENEAGRIALQDAMGDYLRNFMTDGQPGTVEGFEWQPWSNVPSEFKAITFDADANDVILGAITEELTFADVTDAFGTQYATVAAEYGPELAGAWAFLSGFLADNEAEPLRFIARNHLQIEAIDDAEAFGGTYGYYTNEISGYQIAGYWIEIPDNWNGDLVLYAHGFRGDASELSLSMPAGLRQHLVDNGYAWGASSYGENGYQIATGVVGTHELLRYFAAKHGEPTRVYITGHSMGGHVTARSVTEYPDAYDGALPMCGVVGGALEQFSFSTDMALLANYFTGLNAEVPMTAPQTGTLFALTFGSVDPPVPSPFGYIPHFGPAAPFQYDPEDETRVAALTPTGELFKEAAMHRSGGERPLFHAAFSNKTLFQVAGQGFNFVADPEQGIGLGNVVDNWDYQFYVEDEDVRTALNVGIKRIQTNPAYLGFSEAIMYPVHGHINMPVLSLADMGDYFVPFSHQVLYADRVDQAGRSDQLRMRPIRSISHCGYIDAEVNLAFDDLVAWVEQGIVPAGYSAEDMLDSGIMAADDFGCDFTLAPRPEDTTYGADCLGIVPE